MKLLIYGGGAVGLGIASCLIKAGCKVDIIARNDTVRHLKKNRLIRNGIFGRVESKPTEFGVFSTLDDIIDRSYDYILVCVKSFDSLSAAKDLYKSSIAQKTTKIVLCQNGWGNAEIFIEFFAKEQIFNGRIITGFTRRKPNEVIITVHADPFHIGSLFSIDSYVVNDLCKMITSGGIPCEPTDDIEKDIWAKMLYNCALNPLGAILDVNYGQLAEHDTSIEIMNGIIEEIFEVLSAGGYKTHWSNPKEFLQVFYTDLIPATAEHSSSMLQDIHAKKKTEIDALNGAVIKIAERYSLNTPYNRVLFNIIKFIESHNQNNL
jgi:2-dehydropantoate 2-reductase